MTACWCSKVVCRKKWFYEGTITWANVSGSVYNCMKLWGMQKRCFMGKVLQHGKHLVYKCVGVREVCKNQNMLVKRFCIFLSILWWWG